MAHKSYVGLLVPGHRPGELEKAFRMAVPTLTVDLCKTVPEQERWTACHLVAAALEEFVNREKRTALWVPVQSLEVMKKEFAMLLRQKVDQIRVSAVRSVEEMCALETALEDSVREDAIPGVELVVDHVDIYERLEEICHRGRYVQSLTLGVYDLWQSLSPAGQTTENLHRMKHEIVRIARMFGLLPMDAVHVNYYDLERFAADCRTSQEMGFCGRYVIHPSQMKIGMKIYDGGE